jgi:hypothetical protein
MQTYVVTTDAPKLTHKQKLATVLLSGAIYSILMFCAKWFWPSSAERQQGLASIAIQAGLMGLFFGILMAFFPRRRSACKLLVDEDSITAVREPFGWMRWLSWRSTVRKGKLRTIFDFKSRYGSHRGIGLSERGRFVARMLGFVVFVPNTLHEYEDIRRLAESWLRKTEADLH